MSNKEKEVELKFLRDKCILFNQFMIKEGGIPSQLVSFFEDSNKLIESAYLEGKMKPLKSMNADIDNQIMKHMPFPMAKKIKILFDERLGINYDLVSLDQKKSISAVIKRQKILTRYEYELLLERVDDICGDVNQEEELSKLNLLLAAYEKQNTTSS
ncbi:MULTISPECIES: hypothetical protein [unclassified Sphingobacterium]|uniref:hypothetical protein n=1 Tax=unclassified Sphingobacterium TaxID=2609468 RepID=UPI0025EF9553|nr:MULTISPECIES: hypothetical protein [unclassified Sphingobacterium]